MGYAKGYYIYPGRMDGVKHTLHILCIVYMVLLLYVTLCVKLFKILFTIYSVLFWCVTCVFYECTFHHTLGPGYGEHNLWRRVHTLIPGYIPGYGTSTRLFLFPLLALAS